MRDLRRLKCFVAVAEELHFRKAAERVSLTQPALSQQIRELEKELNTSLFDRDRRSVALTEAGRALLPAATQAVQLVEEAAETIATLGEKADRRLRLGYVEYLNLPFLTPALRTLRQKDKTIDVDPQELHSDAVIQSLIAREIDLGIAFLPVKHPALASRKVVQGQWMLAMPEDHELAGKKSVPLSSLADRSLIMFARHLNPPLHDFVVDTIRKAIGEPDIPYRVTQAVAGPKYVLDGLGLFVHASYVIDEMPEGVVRRPISGFPKIELAAVWRGDHRTRAVRAFLDAVKAVMAD